jgi:hypothetical protein
VSRVAAPITNVGPGRPKSSEGGVEVEVRWDWSEAGIAL